MNDETKALQIRRVSATRLVVCALAIALAAIGLASCESATGTVKVAARSADVSTSPAPTSSAPPASSSGTTTDGIDVDALHAKVVEYRTKNPDATVTSAVAVRTDRSALLALTGDEDDPQAQGTQVIVLQLRGRFPTMVPSYSIQKQADSTRVVPVPSAKPRTATVITESMSVDLTKVYDVATQYPGNKIIDLSSLNAPMVTVPID